MNTRTISHSSNRRSLQNAHDTHQGVFGSQTEEAQLGIISFQENQVYYANSYMSKISGYSREDLLQMQFVDLIHPDSQSLLMNRINTILKGFEQSCHLSLKALKKTGKEYWIETDISVFYLNGIRSILAIVFDITDQTGSSINMEESR